VQIYHAVPLLPVSRW